MKENILLKATDMFITLGFKSVTMDDLATEMGISKKTIYKHYKNKTELVEASALALFKLISEGINIISARKSNPIEELYEIKKFVMFHLKDEKSSPQYQLQKYYPEIYKNLKCKQFDVMQECVTDNLNRGIEEALYRSTINVSIISRLYFSGMISIKDQELFPQELFSINTLMENYLEYHLRGISTEKGLHLLNQLVGNKKLTN
ncbi:MAG: TetR family transcriptional regulator [Kordia sp.]|nr:MAG: TetR family transcriptional regulator [Kordia sp.]